MVQAVPIAGQTLPEHGDRSLRSRLTLGMARDEQLIVHLDSRAPLEDIAKMPLGAARKTALVDRLTSHAAATQKPLVAVLDELKARGYVRSYESLWSPNSLHVTPTWGNGDAVRAALQVQEVSSIWGAKDARLLWRDGVMDAAEAGAQAALPKADNPTFRPTLIDGEPTRWNLDMVGATEANAAGHRGAGVRFGSIDTGVDWRHPDLRGNYAGAKPDGSVDHDYAWTDQSHVSLPFPHDFKGHGTGTMDVAVGKEMGVAPDATWIAARGERWHDQTGRVKALQWMLAPTRLDGSAPRPDLAPDVLGISWNAGNPRETFFAEQMRHFEAAGIFVSKAAGNEGLDPKGTITSPGQFETVFTSAAVDATGTIAPFSSHGPSPLPHPTGTQAIAKPEVAAPGVDVPAAFPHLPFLHVVHHKGTSFAQPHSAGGAIILRGEHPTLSNGEIRDLMQATARDAGQLGRDARYGAGILDIPAALEAAAKLHA